MADTTSSPFSSITAVLCRCLSATPGAAAAQAESAAAPLGASLAGIALALTMQPLCSEAADFTASTAAELVAAITTANSTQEADTITLTSDITLTATNNATYGPTGLPVVSSALTITGNHHAIRREPSNPDHFRLLAINETGNLILQDTTLSGGSPREEAPPGFPYYSFSGGGIFTSGGHVTLVGCTISGNTAFSGGGVWGGTITNSTISGNTALSEGGGCGLSRVEFLSSQKQLVVSSL